MSWAGRRPAICEDRHSLGAVVVGGWWESLASKLVACYAHSECSSLPGPNAVGTSQRWGSGWLIWHRRLEREMGGYLR